ncbi:MAG: hypothetical protein NE328_13310 [Lentisphaeraceae bacterium]|nr:hypothetical protein [Lentisphaeraceae bacterium]
MIDVIKLENIPNSLSDQMCNFERSFCYPLGNSGNFSISHGDDYSRFFRAMGKCKIYLARHKGQIAGSLAVVKRPIYLNGNKQESLYIGDLKITKGNGKVLYCLIKEAHDDNLSLRDIPQYGIMMKGTERRPSDYTGRLGLPKFKNMGEVAIIRVPVNEITEEVRADKISLHGAISLCEELRAKESALPIGRTQIRSLNVPKAFCLEGKTAVCILEDTMTAKRLFSDDGTEIVSGHLSAFQYLRAVDGVELVRSMLPQAAAAKYPALFFSVPYEDQGIFTKNLPGAKCAPAFVYGRNMEASSRWQLNTSEI